MKSITILKILYFACIVIVFSSIERLGWPLAIVLLFLLYMVDRNIEKEEKTSKRLPSYRLELLIEPHWYDIFERILPGLEDGEEFLVIKLLRATNRDYDKLELAMAKYYHEFVFFYHKNTIAQVWNAETKTFVEYAELMLRMFPYFCKWEDEALIAIDDLSTNDEEFNKLISKQNMKENLIKLFYNHDYFDKEGDYFRIQAVFGKIMANFATLGPIGDIVDGEKLASIPLGDVIIPFLYEVNKHTISGAMQGVKTFPKNIHDRFTKENITYFDKNKQHNIEYNSVWDFSDSLVEHLDKKWAKKTGVELYSNEVTHHWFSTKYFSIGVQVEFYNDEDKF
ncbi:MAG: hypothetical protein PHD43_20255 [Methylococcales bacterium]|nr:hypothetical protein [Methylococcales bacterium]